MAGQPTKKEREGTFSYGGHTYVDGYKPLELTLGRPNIDYTFRALDESSLVDKVVTVGRFEELLRFIESQDYKKKPIVVPQKGTISENAGIAYRVSKANSHVLFIPSDIPRISSGAIDDFLKKCMDNGSYDFYAPIVSMESKRDRALKKSEKSVKLIDDRGLELEEEVGIDKHGRRAFRVTNMIYSDFGNIKNPEVIDVLYRARQFWRKENILFFSRFLKRGKFPPKFRRQVFSSIGRYFGPQKNAKMSEAEEIASGLLGTNFCFVDIYHPEVDDDVDTNEQQSMFNSTVL